MKRRTVLVTSILILFSSHSMYGQQKDGLPIAQGKTNTAGGALPKTSPFQSPVKKIQENLGFSSGIKVDSFFVMAGSQSNRITDSLTYHQYTSRFQMVQAQFNAVVFKIPLNVKYQYQQTNGFLFPGSISMPVIDFNRDQFVKTMGERIRRSLDVNSLVSERLAAIHNLQDVAMKELKTDMRKVVKTSNKEAHDKINQLGDWKEMVGGDKSFIQKKFVGEKELASLASNEQLVARAQEKLNNGETIDTAAFNNASKEIQKVKELQEIAQVIIRYKKKWDESGLVKLVKKMESEKDMQLQEILRNPTVLSQMAKSKLSLQKFEKIFLGIKQLQTGSGSNNLSPMTLDQSMRSSGFTLETIGKGMSSVFATMGNIPELVSVAERSLAEGSQVNQASSMAGISLGNKSTNGNQQEIFSKVSLLSFATSSSGSGTNMLSPLSGSVARNLVFTVSKKIAIGTRGSLVTEISKSASQEQNKEKIDGGSNGNSFSTSKFFGSGDFLSNLGFSAEYSNEFPGIEFSHEMEVRYTGNGYSNPGNAYLLSGSKEVYNSMQKTFFNHKVNVIVKNRYRSFNLDNNGKRVDNFSNTIDVRWKFSKGNYVALKYQPSYSGSVNGGITQNAVNTQRVAADLNIRAKVYKMQVYNFINLAYLSTHTSFTGLTDELYKTIQLTSTHSMAKGSSQFFMNTSFNYAFSNGSLPYLNNSFLMEGGIVYDLTGAVKLTSALNYNAVQNWYSQMVFKQGIGSQIGKRFDLNFTIDVAKNFKVLQPYPVQNLRSDISLRYLIF